MNRRNFISHSLAASAAVVARPLSCTPSDHPLVGKSLKYGMIKEDLSVIEKFRLIKRLGFDGIELDSPSDLDHSEVLDAIEETGIVVPGLVNSLHWKNPMSHPDQAVRTTCTDSMHKALEDCKKFGGTTVLLVPATVNAEVSYEEAWERSTAEIHKILPTAQSTGISIAIENVWNNFLLSPMEASRYIDQFDSPMIGWYMDIGNIIRYGWPEHWIRTLGKRILKVDIKDYSRDLANDQGVWKGFQAKLGEGSVDWSKVNMALSDIGYSGWGSAEVSGGKEERLKEISDRMDALYSS